MATSNRGREAFRTDGQRGDRRGLPGSSGRWLAIGIALVIGHSQAHAAPCAPPTPACHLENGRLLLQSDPRRAAEELLASYQLDERTETLELYAAALELDHRYALALETWKRVIVFRDSEVETASETIRTATGRKRTAARAAAARAQKLSEQAADAIIKLWPRVGRVRVRLTPGQQVAVSRDGVEVDPARDVVVNAGRDELVFTRKDGSVDRVVIEVAAGGVARIDAPSERIARPAPQPSKPDAAPPRPEAAPKPDAAPPKVAVAQPRPEPKLTPKPTLKPTLQEPEAAEPDEPQVPAAALSATPPADKPGLFTMSRVGLGLTAGAVVAGGLAAGFGYLASRDYDDSRAMGCSADGKCPFGPAADLAQQSNDRARIAQISAIGAGVLAATGVTLWIVGRRREGETRHAISDLALHIGPSSTAISGRF